MRLTIEMSRTTLEALAASSTPVTIEVEVQRRCPQPAASRTDRLTEWACKWTLRLSLAVLVASGIVFLLPFLVFALALLG